MTPFRIQVMISSRCEDKIQKAGGGSIKLTDLRKRAKATIEGTKLFGRDTFDCWIHEDKAVLPGNATAWNQCMSKVKACHILLVLYNGSAGFDDNSQMLGICHAEMMAALNTAARKVYVIDITKATIGKITGDAGRNQRFAKYVEAQALDKRFAENDDEALERMLEAIQAAVIDLTDRGSISHKGDRYSTGAPVEWSRYDYAKRKSAIEEILRASMNPRGSSDPAEACIREINGVPVYFACHAVPAAMSVPAAREMVGRPFLRDHESLPLMRGKTAGPVHLIGCHKSVTENQAVSLLGFPDATILTPEFGIYVADDINKIQLILLANCRDESTTREAVRDFHSWLGRIDEAQHLARRAAGRKAIITAIAAEMGGGVKGAGG
jgi:hypothetical protein